MANASWYRLGGLEKSKVERPPKTLKYAHPEFSLSENAGWAPHISGGEIGRRLSM